METLQEEEIRDNFRQALTLKLFSGGIEGYSYTLDHDSKFLYRDLKLGPSVQETAKLLGRSFCLISVFKHMCNAKVLIFRQILTRYSG